MFWGNMMLSHWPCFTWKFFMIKFHRILKLIFQKQSICPRNICIELWWKLPNLRAFFKIFFYLKNNDSGKTCAKSFINCTSHLFPRKNNIFHTASGRSGSFEFLFWFRSAILLSNMKSLFFSLWKCCRILHVIFESTSQFFLKYCINHQFHQT